MPKIHWLHYAANPVAPLRRKRNGSITAVIHIYKDAVLTTFGVDLSSAKFRGNGKWSQRLRSAFLDQGKPFSNEIIYKVKYVVAEAISKNAKSALNSHKRNSIDALVTALERMIKS